MKRSTSIIIAVVVIFILAAVAAFALARGDESHDMGQMQPAQDQTSDTSAGSTSKAVATDTVEIKEFAYSPSAITVKAGTTVTWTNRDTARHNVETVGDAPEAIDGKLLGQGETFSYTFDKAGTYNYICGPHPYMKGTVTVTE